MANRSPHPWLAYHPPHRQMLVSFQRCLLLTRARLRRPRYQILFLLGLYVLGCLIPLPFGLVTLAGFAILPLLLVPPVGFLIYWLVWKEFHH